MQDFNLSDELIFNGENGFHEYMLTVNGKPQFLESVTEILGPHFEADYSDEGILDRFEDTDEGIAQAIAMRENVDRAAQRGSEFHDFLEQYLKGIEPEYGDIEMLNFAEKICSELGIARQLPMQSGETRESWLSRQPENVAYSEIAIYSTGKAVPYAGKLDILFFDKEKGWSIVDLKTTRNMDSSKLNIAKIQEWMYANAAKERFGIEVKNFYVALPHINQIIPVASYNDKVVSEILDCHSQNKNYRETKINDIVKSAVIDFDTMNEITLSENWANFCHANAKAQRDYFETEEQSIIDFKEKNESGSIKVNGLTYTNSKARSSNSFDKTNFQKEHPAEYAKYCKPIDPGKVTATISVSNKKELENSYTAPYYPDFASSAVAAKYYGDLAKTYNDQKKALKEPLVQAMKDASFTVFSYKNFKISIANQLTPSLDTKKLKEEEPDLFAEYNSFQPGIGFTSSITCPSELVADFSPAVQMPDFKSITMQNTGIGEMV